MTNEEFLKSISLEGEIWKPVVGYEESHVVSNMGRVVRLGYSNTTKTSHGTIGIFTYPPKILKQSKWNSSKDLMKHGSYLTVTLGKGKGRTRRHVHSLVAKSFIPNPNNYPHIDHINGDRSLNAVSNLRWASAKMNMNNPITKQRIKESLTGKPSPLRIPVIAIFADGSTKTYESMLATKQDNYSPNCVYNCCKGIKDIHKGVRWMYLSKYEASKSAMSKNSLESGEE